MSSTDTCLLRIYLNSERERGGGSVGVENERVVEGLEEISP